MIERDFKAEVEELHVRFILDSPPDGQKTDLDSGEGILLHFLKIGRLRNGVTKPGADRDQVDAQTIALLKNSDKLGPEHSIAEAAFRRLARNPESAAKYVDDARKAFREEQSRRAKKLRPKARDSITRLIEDIIKDAPTKLSAKAVGRTLERRRREIKLNDDEYHHQDGTKLKISLLDSRVSDAYERNPVSD
jgi:hypothetical protein